MDDVVDSPWRKDSVGFGRMAELSPQVCILHVDMDAFFASVEVLDNPSLMGKPVIVGGTGDRGVVAACTYAARAFGVHSAMPIVRARQLCREAIVLPGRFDRYQEISAQVHEVFKEVTDLIEPIGLDEAFLDVAPARRRLGDAVFIANLLRARIREVTQLEACVGVGQSKMMAKLASKRAKPRATKAGVTPGQGVFVVLPQAEEAFLRPLPIRALWGVGPATADRLERVGLATVGQVADLDLSVLQALVGTAAGEQLFAMSHGVDRERVVGGRAMKAMSQEQTFATDLQDKEALRAVIANQAERLASSLRSKDLRGRTVTLKVRYADFHQVTRSATQTHGVSTGKAISTVADGLLNDLPLLGGVRLIGVSVSGLIDAGPEQMALFSEQTQPQDVEASWQVVDETVDAIRAKFGNNAVGLARNLKPKGLDDVTKQRNERFGPEAEDLTSS